MLKNARLMISLLVLVNFLATIPRSTINAQSAVVPAGGLWPIPPQCDVADFGGCDVRLSLEGDLYFLEYTEDGPRLYASRQGEMQYTEYELVPLWVVNGTVDFVPFSDQNVVIFYSRLDHGYLSRLDLLTHEMSLMPQMTEFDRPVHCNGFQGFGGNFNRISRLGTGGQVLVCSVSQDRSFLVNIVDVVSQATIASFDFDLPWWGAGEPYAWHALIGGQDGNIYIDTIDDGIDPGYLARSLVAQELIDSLTNLPTGGRRLFRYEVSSSTWSVRNLYPDQLASSNYLLLGHLDISRLAAVLPNGDFIYRVDWSNGPQNRGVEVNHYDTDFHLVERISSEAAGEYIDFKGIDSEGLVVLRFGRPSGYVTGNFQINSPLSSTPQH